MDEGLDRLMCEWIGGWIDKQIETVKCYAVGAQEFLSVCNKLVGRGA